MSSVYIAIDFDGTIVQNDFPDIGPAVPKALYWIKEFQKLDAKIILWTVRDAEALDEAVKFCQDNGIELFATNDNPEQKDFSNSPKIFAHIYIDDRNAWCPLGGTKNNQYVDWNIIGPWVVNKIKEINTKK